MSGADPDRFEPLLEIRRVAQRAEVGRVAEAVTASTQRDRELAAAEVAVAVARGKVAQADDRLAALAAGGTTAQLVCMAAAYARRCRGELRNALAEREAAAGAQGASEATLAEARERLVAARNHREIVERYLERARLGRRQLRERREE
jgi:hypothetical protein